MNVKEFSFSCVSLFSYQGSCRSFLSATAFILYQSCFCLSRTFFDFSFLKKSNGEGGIWTLAPLLTAYSLSRGAPSATWVLLQMPKWYFHLVSGESGIRTHAPLRTNGFQDRLVMTTSISLHLCFILFVYRSVSATSDILAPVVPNVNTFFDFFLFFYFFRFFILFVLFYQGKISPSFPDIYWNF